MSITLSGGDSYGVKTVLANYVLGGDDFGALNWTPNRPEPGGRSLSFYEFGCADAATQFAQTLSSGTATAAFGDDQRQGVLILSTGSSATGAAARCTNVTMIQLASTSGTWTHETIVQVPTLDNGTDTFTVAIGFIDTLTGASSMVDGCYLEYNKTTRGANWFLTTSSNSTRTATDTGVAVVAGTNYYLKVQSVGNGTVNAWVQSDPGTSLPAFGSPTSTNATNIPTGASRVFGAGIALKKSASTSARTIQYVSQQARYEPARTPIASLTWSYDGDLMVNDGAGLGSSSAGQIVAANQNSTPAMIERSIRMESTPWIALDLPNEVNFGNLANGTGAAQNLSTVVTGLPTLISLTTGTTSSGYLARSCPNQSNSNCNSFGPNSGTYVYETVFRIPTLSASGQQFACKFGFQGDTGSTPNFGAYAVIDSFASGFLKLVTVVGGTATTTTTSLTIAAATNYYLRLVVTGATSVALYCAAIGSTWSSALATNSANVPSGTGQAVIPTAMIQKSSGTTAALVNFTHQLVYQKRAA